jgi:hypothetical protein
MTYPPHGSLASHSTAIASPIFFPLRVVSVTTCTSVGPARPWQGRWLSRLDGCLCMDKQMRQCLYEGTCKDCEAWGGRRTSAARRARGGARRPRWRAGITPRPTAGVGASLSDARGDPSTPSPSTPSPSDANMVSPSTRRCQLLLVVVVVIGGVDSKSISWWHRATRGSIA